MDMKKAFLFGGIGLLAFYWLKRAKQFYEGLTISFQNVSIKGTVSNPIIVIELKIKNPSDLSVKINEIKGNLLYKNNIVGTVKSVDQDVIDSGSVLFYDLEVKSTITNLLQIIQGFILNKKSFDFYFDGTINLNGLNIPYKQKLEW